MVAKTKISALIGKQTSAL